MSFTRPQQQEAYRLASEVQQHIQHCDPLALFRRKLEESGFPIAGLTAVEAEVTEAVVHAIAFAEASPLPSPTEVYQDMYVNPINYPPTMRSARP